jgi:hypothetical protein
MLRYTHVPHFVQSKCKLLQPRQCAWHPYWHYWWRVSISITNTVDVVVNSYGAQTKDATGHHVPKFRYKHFDIFSYQSYKLSQSTLVLQKILDIQHNRTVAYIKSLQCRTVLLSLWQSPTKVPCTLGRTYTEGTWLYCDYFIWCVYVWVFVMCGCLGNTYTCIYYVLYCCYCFLYYFVYVYSFLFVLSVLV